MKTNSTVSAGNTLWVQLSRFKKWTIPKHRLWGTLGEVIGVDDLGDLEMLWSTGSSLKVILSEDRIRKVNGAITICYGHREYWRSRKEAADYFLEGLCATEGSESERYSKIYAELICGKTICSDEYEDL